MKKIKKMRSKDKKKSETYITDTSENENKKKSLKKKYFSFKKKDVKCSSADGSGIKNTTKSSKSFRKVFSKDDIIELQNESLNADKQDTITTNNNTTTKPIKNLTEHNQAYKCIENKGNTNEVLNTEKNKLNMKKSDEPKLIKDKKNRDTTKLMKTETQTKKGDLKIESSIIETAKVLFLEKLSPSINEKKSSCTSTPTLSPIITEKDEKARISMSDLAFSGSHYIASNQLKNLKTETHKKESEDKHSSETKKTKPIEKKMHRKGVHEFENNPKIVLQDSFQEKSKNRILIKKKIIRKNNCEQIERISIKFENVKSTESLLRAQPNEVSEKQITETSSDALGVNSPFDMSNQSDINQYQIRKNKKFKLRQRVSAFDNSRLSEEEFTHSMTSVRASVSGICEVLDDTGTPILQSSKKKHKEKRASKSYKHEKEIKQEKEKEIKQEKDNEHGKKIKQEKNNEHKKEKKQKKDNKKENKHQPLETETHTKNKKPKKKLKNSKSYNPKSIRTNLQPKTKIFGQSLDQVMITTAKMVPKFLFKVMNIIEKNGKNVVGIYRMSGDEEKIKSLINSIDNNMPVNILDTNDETDLNTYSNLLKRFYRNIPESLIPNPHASELINIYKNNQDKAEVINVLSKLPLHTRVFSYILFSHLKKISENSAINMMDPMNMSICFAPSLLPVSADDVFTFHIKNNIISDIITKYETLIANNHLYLENISNHIPIEFRDKYI